MAFRFLLSKDGREVETTFFHRKLTGKQRPGDPSEVWSGSSIFAPLAAGATFTESVDLKHLYEITAPGQYKLDISRIAEDGKTVVHGNSVTLNIVP
jgi:hypothetical protein